MAANRTGGLGRGLGELFQRTDGPAERPLNGSAPMPDGSFFARIPVADIQPNPNQPRQVFDEDELDELAASIQEVGLLQPVVVRRKGQGYELVMGERRWRAHQRIGLPRIAAIVRATDDIAMLRDALLENLHRTQLNPLEEAAAYRQLLDDFGCTKEELANRIKRSRPHISNTLRLLGLPAQVQRRVAAGVLSAGHARALLMLPDAPAQERFAQRIVAEGLSVRATEELVALALREGQSTPAARTRTTRPVPDELTGYANGLADRLDTRVRVQLGARRGRLTIEFADAQDLERIMELLDPRDGNRSH